MMVVRLIIRLGAFAMLSAHAVAQPADEADATTDDRVIVLPEQVDAVAETIRCVVCQNQSIADSEAPLARNMVAVIEERLAAGDSPEEVQAYLVTSYGEAILLRPRWSAQNLGLWLGPLAALILGAALAIGFILSNGRSKKVAAAPLSDEERAELDRLLAEDQPKP